MADTKSSACSQQIIISSADLDKFYNCKPCLRFASKTISIKNISFRIDLYPNESGFVQFYLLCNKFASNINQIILFCRLYCKQLDILFKSTKRFTKSNDSISWGMYQMQLQRDIAINQLDFGCDIELLQSIDINDNITFYDHLYHFKRSTTISSIQFEWKIRNKITMKLFKTATTGKSYYCRDINHIWSLCCFPNGRNDKNNGSVLLSLELLRLPPKIKAFEINFELKSVQINIEPSYKREGVLFNYDEPKQEWSSKLFPTYLLQAMDTLTSTANIEIIKIFEYGKNGKSKKVKKSLWNTYGIECIHIPEYGMDIDHDGGIDVIIENEEESVSNTTPEPNEEYDEKYRSPQSRMSESEEDLNDSLCKRLNRKHIKTKVNVHGLQQSQTKNVKSTNGAKLKKYDSRSRNKHISWWNKSGSIDAITQFTDDLNDGYIEENIDKLNDINDEENKYKKLNGNHDHDMMDKVHYKFIYWLSHIVELGDYLYLFEQNGKADIRKIKYLNDTMLIDLGINDENHRALILDKAKEFGKLQMEFVKILDSNQVLKPFKQKLRSNGILTFNDLKRDIGNKTDLMQIFDLNVSEKKKIEEIWSIIHGAESLLDADLKALQQHQLRTMHEMELLIQEMIEMDDKISNGDDKGIELKHIKMMDEYSKRLKNHQRILDKLKCRNKMNDIKMVKKSVVLKNDVDFGNKDITNINV